VPGGNGLLDFTFKPRAEKNLSPDRHFIVLYSTEITF
jgi:hypothetical protein